MTGAPNIWRRCPLRGFARLVLAALLAPSSGWATEREGEGPPSVPFLYEVTGPALEAPSYLLGTIHLNGPEIKELVESLDSLIGVVDVVATELALDPRGLRDLLGGLRAPPRAGGLFERLPPDLADDVKQTLAEMHPGVPAFAFSAFEPWALPILLTEAEFSRGRPGQPLDMQLYLRARAAGRQMAAVETIDQQVAAFRSMEDAEVWSLLRQLLSRRAEEPDFYPRLYDEMYQAYLAGDADRVRELVESEFSTTADARAIEEKLMDHILHQRDRQMAEWVAAEFQDHPSRRYLIAVGTLHLITETGLPAQLRAAGYQVRRLSELPATAGSKSSMPGDIH